MNSDSLPTSGGTGRWRRHAAAGGIAGPVSFAATWWLVGRSRPGYSAVAEPVSRLASYRSATRPAMTAGFAGYAAGVAALAAGLSGSDRRVAAGLAANAASMVAVAALPLDAPYGDGPHVAAATVAYASLALTPLVAARSGRTAAAPGGPGASAGAGTAFGVGTAALLVLSQAVPSRRGLFQRMGLSLGHAWIAGRALRELTRSSGRRPGAA